MTYHEPFNKEKDLISLVQSINKDSVIKALEKENKLLKEKLRFFEKSTSELDLIIDKMKKGK